MKEFRKHRIMGHMESVWVHLLLGLAACIFFYNTFLWVSVISAPRFFFQVLWTSPELRWQESWHWVQMQFKLNAMKAYIPNHHFIPSCISELSFICSWCVWDRKFILLFVPIWPLIARWYDWITSCFSLPVCCKGFFRVKVRSTGYLWIFNQLKASFWHGLYRVELWRGLAMLGFSSVGGHALKIWVAPLEGLALQLSHKLRCRLTWYFHLQSSISVL